MNKHSHEPLFTYYHHGVQNATVFLKLCAIFGAGQSARAFSACGAGFKAEGSAPPRQSGKRRKINDVEIAVRSDNGNWESGNRNAESDGQGGESDGPAPRTDCRKVEAQSASGKLEQKKERSVRSALSGFRISPSNAVP